MQFDQVSIYLEANVQDDLRSFEFTDFWELSDYASDKYVGRRLNVLQLRLRNVFLPYRLPQSYLNMLLSSNGGLPTRTCFPMSERTSWSEDHIAITGLFGLDRNKTYSITGKIGSEFMKGEWGYPDIGIYICDCPSAGHDMICLDYRRCSRNGEPQVVHVDQEFGFKITFVADTFEEFIRGLRSHQDFA